MKMAVKVTNSQIWRGDISKKIDFTICEENFMLHQKQHRVGTLLLYYIIMLHFLFTSSCRGKCIDKLKTKLVKTLK